jgi:hypothetical protein
MTIELKSGHRPGHLRNWIQMGKIYLFPERRQKKPFAECCADRISFDPPVAAPEPSLAIVCNELGSVADGTDLAVYQITFEGPESLLCLLMRQGKGMAQRISCLQNGYVVVVPKYFHIDAGTRVDSDGIIGMVVASVALGPP